MRRLISADIRRILSKLGFYIAPVAYFLLFLTDFSGSSSSRVKEFDELLLGYNITYKYVFPFVAGIPVFLGVYADELKAGAMQQSIGRGMSRNKIVVGKFIDCVILSFVIYLLSFVLEYISLRTQNVYVSELQLMRLGTLLLASCLKVVGAAAFAAMFVYFTWNASVGLVVELIAVAAAEPMLAFVQDKLKIPVKDFSYMGQVDQLCSNIAAGTNLIIPGIIVVAYVVIFIVISAIIFGRKELEL